MAINNWKCSIAVAWLCVDDQKPSQNDSAIFTSPGHIGRDSYRARQVQCVAGVGRESLVPPEFHALILPGINVDFTEGAVGNVAIHMCNVG